MPKCYSSRLSMIHSCLCDLEDLIIQKKDFQAGLSLYSLKNAIWEVMRDIEKDEGEELLKMEQNTDEFIDKNEKFIFQLEKIFRSFEDGLMIGMFKENRELFFQEIKDAFEECNEKSLGSREKINDLKNEIRLHIRNYSYHLQDGMSKDVVQCFESQLLSLLD